MHPPADPWSEPTEPNPLYGRASVPVPPLREPTTEMPPIMRRVEAIRRGPDVSWQKVKKTSRRQLADGWGFTAAGLIMIFVGWGVWAAAGRGAGPSPWPGLLLALAAAGAIFVLARFLGFLVLERMWGRSRRHARWSHLLAGLFLAMAGIGYLINTKFMVDTWLKDGWDYIGQLWQSVS
jgi:eukaryotic-like serine/threonine-protein kinase